MANEIYSKSWWGSGVCDNTVGWGLVYKPYASCTPAETRFVITIKTDNKFMIIIEVSEGVYWVIASICAIHSNLV